MMSRRCPTARDGHPFGEAAALLALDVDDVRVAPASTSHPVLLLRVVRFPVLVLFLALLLIERRLFEERRTRQLTCRSIRRTMLDGRMSVAEVPEVVDILGREQRARRQRMNRRIAPLPASALEH